MVKPKSLVVLVLTLSVSAGLSSCGMKHWLGEAPPPAKIVSKSDANSQSGSSVECADWSKIYQGTEAESAEAFECWVAKEPDVWKRIRGARPGELTEREITLLIRDGVLPFEGDEAARETWARRVIALKTLVGFGPTLTRARVSRWISWARAHRADLRIAYQRVFPIGKTNSFTFADGQRVAATAASFLRELEWDKSSTELAPLVGDLLGVKDTEITAGLEPGMRVLRNLIGFACPVESDESRIMPAQLADCVERASRHFVPGARWIEFLINNKGAVFEPQVADIKKSLDATTPLISSWFQQPQLKPLDTKLWFEWARTMGAKPPENFIDSLKCLRRLKSKSTENAIDPVEMTRLFALAREYEVLVLDGIPHFARAYQDHACKNASATSWKDCALRDLSIREKSKTIDMLLRVKNPRHGFEAVPINGSAMSAIAFFDAVSQQLIDIFDEDRDGVISADLRNERDELVGLITTSIETYQSVNHYLNNIGRRLDGDVARAPDDGISLNHWNLRGFAKLVATTHDVLVERTHAQRLFFQKFLANIGNNFPVSALFLDRPAITAVLTTITSLPHYREIALQEILGDEKLAKAAMDDNKPIPRERFQNRLGEMLKRNFPRTHQSCTGFGFQVSCFIAFDEVLPSADDKRFVMPADLDVLTIMAIGMEGVFDTCGRNQDGTLAASLFDGDDDLDCGFTRMKDVALRLLEAKVVQTDPRTALLAKKLLQAVNAVFLTRTVGKVALIRGTKNNPLANLPLFWAFGKTATIGSSYGLLSDIVASDRVDEAKSNPM